MILSLWHLQVFLVIYIISCSLCKASMGDRDPKYDFCTNRCLGLECVEGITHASHANVFPTFYNIQIMSWDCQEICEYKCMTQITNDRMKRNFPILKYFGHWPFQRWFGLEEPASVVFALSNALPHILFILFAWKQCSWKYSMTWYVLLYALISINAWIAAANFHAKKTAHAVQYDYISAFVVVAYGMFVAIRQWLGPRANPFLTTILFLLTMFAIGVRVYHMIFLPSTVPFDLHMNTCIALVMIATLTWLGWAGKVLYDTHSSFATTHFAQLASSSSSNTSITQETPASQSIHHNQSIKEWEQSLETYRMQLRSNAWYCMGIQLWLACATMLEIFDFPPYFGLFDAHCVWHGATIPLGYLWYRFWLACQQNELQENALKCKKNE